MGHKEATFAQTKPINPDRLNDEIKAVLGDKYISMDTGKPHLTVDGTVDETKDPQIVLRAASDATEDDLKRVETIIEAHNPALLSRIQQRAKDRVDAYQRFKGFDFEALTKLKAPEQMPVVIGLLRDIQVLMQSTDNG